MFVVVEGNIVKKVGMPSLDVVEVIVVGEWMF